jgi:hypothetical protein
MRSLITLPAVVLSLTSGIAPAQPDAEALRKIDAEWTRSYAEHDTATAMKIFDDRIIVTSGTGALKDKQGELADVRPAPGMQVHYFRSRDVEIRQHEGTAVVAGLIEWSVTFNGRTSNLRRRYTATYARGGPLGWRMMALHIGPAPNPG